MGGWCRLSSTQRDRSRTDALKSSHACMRACLVHSSCTQASLVSAHTDHLWAHETTAACVWHLWRLEHLIYWTLPSAAACLKRPRLHIPTTAWWLWQALTEVAGHLTACLVLSKLSHTVICCHLLSRAVNCCQLPSQHNSTTVNTWQKRQTWTAAVGLLLTLITVIHPCIALTCKVQKCANAIVSILGLSLQSCNHALSSPSHTVLYKIHIRIYPVSMHFSVLHAFFALSCRLRACT